jgi:hypothetical protein
LLLIDQRDADVEAMRWMPMRLPEIERVGKKPDRFYGLVLVYKYACEHYGIGYAERLARDNNVDPGVVYRWVFEAKRRGITIDDGGAVFIHGEPMSMDR